MMDSILNVAHWWVSGWAGLFLYFVPMSFCIFGYILRTHKNFQKDRKAREKIGDIYIPTDTLGDLVGRVLICFIPIANIWAAMFDLSREVFGRFFNWLSEKLDKPCVPDSPRYKEKRKKYE